LNKETGRGTHRLFDERPCIVPHAVAKLCFVCPFFLFSNWRRKEERKFKKEEETAKKAKKK
jgi:hypothetical protein